MCATQSKFAYIILPVLGCVMLASCLIAILYKISSLQPYIINNYRQHWQTLRRMEQDVRRLCKQEQLQTSEIIFERQQFIPDISADSNGWKIQEFILIDKQRTSYKLFIRLGQRDMTNDFAKLSLLGWRLATNI